MHRIVGIGLTCDEWWKMTNCITHSLVLSDFLQARTKHSPQFCDNQGSYSTLWKTEVFQIVHLSVNLVAECREATVQTLKVVFMTAPEKFFDVLNHDILWSPSLGVDSCTFDELVTCIVFNVVSRLLLTEAGAWSA